MPRDRIHSKGPSKMTAVGTASMFGLAQALSSDACLKEHLATIMTHGELWWSLDDHLLGSKSGSGSTLHMPRGLIHSKDPSKMTAVVTASTIGLARSLAAIYACSKSI